MYFEWVIKPLFMEGSWASSKGICLSNECCKEPGEWPLFSPASNFCSFSSSISWMSFLSAVRSFLKWYFLSIAILLLTVFAAVLWKGRGLYNLRLTRSHYRLFISAIKVKVLYWKKSNICCMTSGEGIVIQPWTLLVSVILLECLSCFSSWKCIIDQEKKISLREDLCNQVSCPFVCPAAFEQVWST